MNLKTIIQDSLTESAKVNSESSMDVDFIKGLELASTMLIDTFQSNGKVLLAGNGGSAADAQHMAAEFIGRYLKERKSYAAIALTTDSSILTALGNDYNFDIIFSRQCEALVNKGDLVIGISTSGNSQNVINAIETARTQNMKTVAVLGFDGGKCKQMVDLPIHFAVDDMQISEDLQLTVGHMVMKWLKKEIG